MLKRMIAVAGLLVLVCAFSPAAARADAVNVAGTTLGAFNAQSLSGSDSLFGLTYNNSSFDVTTVSGFAGIGSAPATPNVDNLGSFSLSTVAASYGGNSFTLQVTFTLPTGITGGNPSTFTATLIGNVTNTAAGGVFINFDNTPQYFTFANSDATGSFYFAVNDVSVTPGNTVSITGTVTGAEQQATVPEPASLILTSVGLVPLFWSRRRRKG